MKEIIESQITLLSQTNEISVPVKISYTDNEVEITLKYNDIEYCGTGSDYLWVDAFADLQRKLPHGVFLACCMTCRHGNMCPYGNDKNQLFCTKDVVLTSKDDVIELMYNKGHDSFFEREVSSIHCCDDFIYQSEDSYTYNDYLYHLQKKLIGVLLVVLTYLYTPFGRSFATKKGTFVYQKFFFLFIHCESNGISSRFSVYLIRCDEHISSQRVYHQP